MDQTDRAPNGTDLNGGDPKANQSFFNGSEGCYYAVHIPSEVQIQEEDERTGNVFKDKAEALNLAKKYKKARFKAFAHHDEALEFASHGTNCSNAKLNNANAGGQVGEKSMPFRGPKSQDLVKLRKAIESGNVALVEDTIWLNPRHLISIGDTPSILQEGSRYNALHVAAKAKNAVIAELILSTISNVEFIKLLYGDECYQDADERAKILLDLYLNTPDKGLNETPLHFAVKFGAAEVVELLVSFPQCDKEVTNKYGNTPAMIICDRCDKATPVLRHKISMLLQDSFYVPVLRSEDNCSVPTIGEPFSPTSPPNINLNPLNPRMEIHAYAGPMKKDGAERFRRLWKTLPRSLKFATMRPADRLTTHNFHDPDKGLERIGKELALKWDVDWREYWPFLDSFVDLASRDGLHQLDTYLAQRAARGNLHSMLGGEQRRRGACGTATSKTSASPLVSPITDLCRTLEACTLSDGGKKAARNVPKNGRYDAATDAAVALADAHWLQSDPSPMVCVERACCVFAHRIATNILQQLETTYTDTFLVAQIKQLQALMASFGDDVRFHGVDFHAVHYRLGALIAAKLRDVLHFEDEHSLMRKTLSGWLEELSKGYDCFSSDDESVTRGRVAVARKKGTTYTRQVMCLLHCILTGLTTSTTTMTGVGETIAGDPGGEEACAATWRELKRCACVWQTQGARRTLTKKMNAGGGGAFAAYKSNGEEACRRLSFDARSGDNCDISNKLEFSIFPTTTSQSEGNSSSDEGFYTPPQSPTLSDDDDFEDCLPPEDDVFIDGNVPTKVDAIVFNAVKYAGEKLNATDYPNVYKWYHAISLYPEEERRSWTIPCIGRYKLNTIGSPSLQLRDSPTHASCASPNLSNKSWIRITGEYSPRKNGPRNLMNYY